MKKIQTQLKTMLGTLSKSLVLLSKQVEKMADKVNQLQGDAPVVAALPKKKAVAKKKEVVKKKEAPAKKAAPKGKKVAEASGTVIDSVMSVINGSKSGIAITEIKEKTKIEGRQLSNALYKLTKRGMIKTQSRGIYVAVK